MNSTPDASRQTPAAARDATSPKPVVPDHELIRPIGKGAYGEVWLARNIMGTWRAVKVVYRNRFDDPRPFEREFAGIQRFEPVSRSHPSQVHILHIGRNEAEGYFYYVMELADDQARGQQIDPDTYAPRTIKSELMLRHRLPAAECTRLAFELTTALEHLHQGGLVHRDIKPSNIIFVDGRPKLADIGLVSDIDATRSYVGTEGYVPPEGPGTVQADVYGLGKVLYELVTGLDRQQFPELPSGQGIDAAEEAVLSEMNEVITRACDPDVKRRYATAGAMRADLELLQAGQSLARLRGVEKRLRFVQRAGAVVTAMAAVIAAGWYWQARQTETVRQLVDEKTRLAQENQQRAMEQTRLATEVSAIAEENRERLVRLSMANGVRLLDDEDSNGALLWFAQALPHVRNRPAEEEIHRIRINAVMGSTPRLLQTISHADGGVIFSGAFSPDGQTIATASYTTGATVWKLDATEPLFPAVYPGYPVRSITFTPDGSRLIVEESVRNTYATFGVGRRDWPRATVLDARTGQFLHYLATNATKTVLSPDTRWLAVARSDFSLAVVDTSDGREATSFKGHTNEIISMASNEEGTLLVTGAADGTARVWRVPSGEPVGPPLAHEGNVFHAVFRPARPQLATVCNLPSSRPRTRPGHIRIWNYVRGVQTLPSKETTETLSVLFYDPQEGRRLFVGVDKALEVWDAETLEEVLPRFEMGSPAECWAFRPDGQALAVGCDDGTTHIWELERGTRLFPPFRHTSSMQSVSFSPDGSKLLTTSNDGTAKVWDLTGTQEIDPEWDPAEWMARSALSRDGSTLAAMWPDRTVSLIDLETFRERTPRQPMPNIDADAQLPLSPYIAVDTTGRQWAAALGQSPSVSLWREEAGELKHLELRHPIPVDYFSFSEPGDRLLTVGIDEAIVRVWSTADGHLIHEAKIPGLDWGLLLFDQAGRRAAFTFQAPHGAVEAGKPKHGLRVLDLETGLVGSATQWFHLQPQYIEFSPDESQIAVTEGWTHILDAESLEFLHSFNHGGGWVTHNRWSPDGQILLTSGGVASDIKLWNATAGESVFSTNAPSQPLVAPLRMAPSERLQANFSADGRFVFATDDTYHVRVWDIATAEPVTPRWRKDARIELLNLTGRLRLNVISASRPCAWDLKPTTLPTHILADYAKLLAGRRLGPGGALLPIPARELAELGRSLRGQHPGLFTVAPEERRDWHRRQLQEPTSLARLRANAFHLDRLAQTGPLDAELEERRAQVDARKLPARDATAPAELIDLTDYYTHSFGVLPNQEFSDLSAGIRTLAGTRFDIRGLVRLEAMKPEEIEISVPQPVVRGVPVNVRCRALHFLQAGENLLRLAEGDEVARWTIHFADDTTLEFPLIYGEHVRDWWHFEDRPLNAGQAELAWQGSPPIPLGSGAKNVVLYKSSWTNPKPEVAIDRLDFVLGKPNTRPFVVAITADAIEQHPSRPAHARERSN